MEEFSLKQPEDSIGYWRHGKGTLGSFVPFHFSCKLNLEGKVVVSLVLTSDEKLKICVLFNCH
jgi:hypothetical protein